MSNLIKPPCSVEGCDRPSYVKGLCTGHNARRMRGASLTDPPLRPWKVPDAPCPVPGCPRKVKIKGMCRLHARRLDTEQDLLKPIRRHSYDGMLCTIEGCTNRARVNDMCSTHASRLSYEIPITAPIRGYRYQGATCSVPGCGNPPHCYTLCGMHYQRGLQHGDVSWEPPTTEERFWLLVDDSGGPDDCWPWQGSVGHGYGRFSLAHNKSTAAHIYALTIAGRPVPPGFQTDHTCHTAACLKGLCLPGNDCLHRRCCNPAHLEAVTPAENIRRRGVAQRAIKEYLRTWQAEHAVTSP